MRWLSVLCLLQPALGFADFGTITQPFGLEPTITVPRPHQLPDDVWMRYAPFQSHITAVAPSVRSLSNGSYATSWSMHFHVEPTRTVAHPGLRRRGVLAPRGILPPITNCRQCDINGNPVSNSNSTDSGSPSCSVVDYEVRLARFPSKLRTILTLTGCLSLRRLQFHSTPRLLLRFRLRRPSALRATHRCQPSVLPAVLSSRRQ